MTQEEQWIAAARSGDQAALGQLIGMCKGLIYNLAIRMLGDPTDAEDATQEILIRVVTGLATFRGDSAFKTWVYRVASNHLLTARKRRAEQMHESLDALGQQLAEGVADGDPPL